MRSECIGVVFQLEVNFAQNCPEFCNTRGNEFKNQSNSHNLLRMVRKSFDIWVIDVFIIFEFLTSVKISIKRDRLFDIRRRSRAEWSYTELPAQFVDK